MQSSGDTRRGAQPGNLRIRRGRRTSQEITVRRVEIQRPRRPGVLYLIGGFLALMLSLEAYVIPEMILTVVVTTILMASLPERYRRPLW